MTDRSRNEAKPSYAASLAVVLENLKARSATAPFIGAKDHYDSLWAHLECIPEIPARERAQPNEEGNTGVDVRRVREAGDVAEGLGEPRRSGVTIEQPDVRGPDHADGDVLGGVRGQGAREGHACDRCGARNTTLKNEHTFLFCHDRAGCDARKTSGADTLDIPLGATTPAHSPTGEPGEVGTYSHFDHPEEVYQRASEEMQEADARQSSPNASQEKETK